MERTFLPPQSSNYTIIVKAIVSTFDCRYGYDRGHFWGRIPWRGLGKGGAVENLRAVIRLGLKISTLPGRRARDHHDHGIPGKKSQTPSPGDMLVLLKIAIAARDYMEFQAPVFKWAEALDLPEPVVSGALRRLASRGYFQAVAEHDGAPGRPVTLYGLSASLRAVLWADPVSPPHPIVVNLLQPTTERLRGTAAGAETPPQRIGTATTMDLTNRLVLVVLWVMADDMGVVRGLGTSDLARYCLMDQTRFQRQTEKLMGLGFIRTFVPGISGGTRFGRLPGIYFLNLRHPSFGSHTTPGFTWLYDPKLILGSEAKRSSGLIRHLTNMARSPLSTSAGLVRLSDFEALLIHLLPDLGPGQADRVCSALQSLRQDQVAYLEVEMERAASEALSSYWTAITDEGVGNGEWLRARVTAIFKVGVDPKSQSSGTADEHVAELPRPDTHDRLPDLIASVAQKLAWSVKRALLATVLAEGDAGAPNFEAMNYLIVPYMRKSGGVHFVIEATYKDSPQTRAYAMYVLMGTPSRQVPCVDEPTSGERLTPKRMVWLGLQSHALSESAKHPAG